MEPTIVVWGICLLIVLAIFGVVGMPIYAPALLRPRSAKSQGRYVAEVWLNWEVCRGSTMYRQRFRTKWGAYLQVKLHAMALDMALPRYYQDTDWSGKRCLYKHGFDILFSVRTLAKVEETDFQPLWSVAMPGSQGYSGEHAQGHPFLRDAKSSLLCSSEDYKL